MIKWDNELWLLTPEEFNNLDDGVRLKCVDDTFAVKGADYIDQDTRAGHLAYGLTAELVKQQNLQNEFLVLHLGR